MSLKKIFYILVFIALTYLNYEFKYVRLPIAMISGLLLGFTFFRMPYTLEIAAKKVLILSIISAMCLALGLYFIPYITCFLLAELVIVGFLFLK